MVLWRWLLCASAGLLVTTLASCVIDVPEPTLWYQNRTDQTVIVTVVGAERTFEQPVRAGDNVEAPIARCQGIGILVKTEDGDLLGQVDEPACPAWVLRINEDGSLEYTKE